MNTAHKEAIADIGDMWLVEVKWETDDWRVHSLHAHQVAAKTEGQAIFDSMPHDRDGDGVRLRTARLASNGLEVKSRVLWAQYCKRVEWKDIIDPEPEEDDEDDGEI